MFAALLGSMFVMFAAGIAVAKAFAGDARIRRALRGAVRCEIAKLVEDQRARISGTVQVERGGELVSPIRRKPCAGYVTVVEQRRMSGSRAYWRTVARHEALVEFLVDDGTGRAVVDINGAQLALESVVVGVATRDAEVMAHVDQLVAELGRPPVRWDHGQVRFAETALEVGARAAVFGTVVKDPDPEGLPDEAYRGVQATRMRLAGSKQLPVMISDSPSTTG